MKELEVCVGILHNKNQFLIGKRKANDKFGGKWEFPGGKIDEGELPEECIIRELKEELNIDVLSLNHYNSYVQNSKNIKLIIHSFIINKYDGKPSMHEHDNLEWVEIKDIHGYDMIAKDIPLINRLKDEFPT